MESFKALQLHKSDSGPDVRWVDLTKDDLMEGDVVVRVSHSTINYKDGLAITGKAPVVRKWPMIPGIDFCGTVVESGSPEYAEGDEVILNGWGVGETHFGGYAQYARVSSDWLVPKPSGFSAAQTMAIGTAGYTAMLCVLALEKNAVSPADGPCFGDRGLGRGRQCRRVSPGQARLSGNRLDRKTGGSSVSQISRSSRNC